MPHPASAAQPCVDVTVRYRDAVVAARRLGGARPDASTPLRIGTLAIVLGLTLAGLDILTGYGSILTMFEPLVLGAGLVALGLVGLVVGLQRRAEPDPESFWVGPASDADFTVDRPGMPDRLAVATVVRGEVTIRPPPGFELFADGKPVAHAVLETDGVLVLQDDELEIELRRSAAAGPAPKLGRPDARFIGGVVLAGLGIGGTILIAHYVVPDPLSIVVPIEHTAHGVPDDP